MFLCFWNNLSPFFFSFFLAQFFVLVDSITEESIFALSFLLLCLFRTQPYWLMLICFFVHILMPFFLPLLICSYIQILFQVSLILPCLWNCHLLTLLLLCFVLIMPLIKFENFTKLYFNFTYIYFFNYRNVKLSTDVLYCSSYINKLSIVNLLIYLT